MIRKFSVLACALALSACGGASASGAITSTTVAAPAHVAVPPERDPTFPEMLASMPAQSDGYFHMNVAAVNASPLRDLILFADVMKQELQTTQATEVFCGSHFIGAGSLGTCFGRVSAQTIATWLATKPHARVAEFETVDHYVVAGPGTLMGARDEQNGGRALAMADTNTQQAVAMLQGRANTTLPPSALLALTRFETADAGLAIQVTEELRHSTQGTIDAASILNALAWVGAGVSLANGGVDATIVGVAYNEDSARAAERGATNAIHELRSQIVVMMLGIAPILDRVQVARDGANVTVHVVISSAEVADLLGKIGGFMQAGAH